MSVLTALTWIRIITGCSRRRSTGASRVSTSRLAALLGGILFVAANALGQQIGPSPTATPTPTPEETSTQSSSQETPAASPVPTVSPTPEPQIAPDLLPGNNALPALPIPTPALRDLIPQRIPAATPGPQLPAPGSAEQSDMDKVRFRQIRTIAVRNPHAVYLLRKARSAPNDELKREYLRVYYLTMCDEMRKLEPRLKPVIDAFESANVGRSSPTGQRPTIPGRDLQRFNAIGAAPSQR